MGAFQGDFGDSCILARQYLQTLWVRSSGFPLAICHCLRFSGLFIAIPVGIIAASSRNAF